MGAHIHTSLTTNTTVPTPEQSDVPNSVRKTRTNPCSNMANDIGPRRGQVNDTEHDAKSETKEKQLIQKTQDGQQLRNHNYGFENTVDPTTMYNA
jgi:hypothetical protein